jgi:hypothetical protein
LVLRKINWLQQLLKNSSGASSFFSLLPKYPAAPLPYCPRRIAELHSRRTRPGPLLLTLCCLCPLDPSAKGYTPLEQQLLDLKAHHPDVLMVEVGYRFRFFGEDIAVAAAMHGEFTDGPSRRWA